MELISSDTKGDPKYIIGLICKQGSLMELVISDTKDGTLNIL